MAELAFYIEKAKKTARILGQIPGYTDWYERLDGLDMTQSKKTILALLGNKDTEQAGMEAIIESAQVVHLKWDEGFLIESGLLSNSIEHLDLDWDGDLDPNYKVCVEHIDHERNKLTEAWRYIIAQS